MRARSKTGRLSSAAGAIQLLAPCHTGLPGMLARTRTHIRNAKSCIRHAGDGRPKAAALQVASGVQAGMMRAISMQAGVGVACCCRASPTERPPSIFRLWRRGVSSARAAV